MKLISKSKRILCADIYNFFDKYYKIVVDIPRSEIPRKDCGNDGIWEVRYKYDKLIKKWTITGQKVESKGVNNK